MGFLKNIFGGASRSKSAEKAPEAQAVQEAPKQQVPQVICPVVGEAIDIAEVNDPAFASKAMGDGIAIKPTEGKLVAPIAGTVVALFPTGHAAAIAGDNGISVMLHIGIDTVKMKGEGFTLHVAQGDRVELGQPLVNFDLDAIVAAGFESTTMVLVAEATCPGTLHKCAFGPVASGQRVLWFE